MRLRLPAVCLILSTLCYVNFVRAEDKVPAEQILPKDTIGLFSIPDVTELKARFSETVWSDVLTNPELGALRDAIKKSFDDAMQEMRDEVGFDPSDVLPLLNGELTFAMTRLGRGKLGLLAAIEYGESDEKLNDLLAKVEKQMEELGTKRSQSEIEGTSIIHYSREIPAGEKPVPQSNELCWFQKDGYLVIGNGLKALESVLVRWEGKNTEILAEKEEFRYVMERCRPDAGSPVAYWYFDPLAIVKTVLEGEVSTTQQALFATGLPQTGLQRLKAIGGTFDLATEKHEDVTRMLIYSEAPHQGVPRMLHGNLEPLEPAAWISAQAETVVTMNWDLVGAWNESRTIFDRIRGAGEFDKFIDGLSEQSPTINLHVQRDLIDQLTGTVIVELSGVQDTAGEADPDPEMQVVTALGLKQEEGMKKVLTVLAESDGSPLTSRSFQGTTIYEIDVPQSPIKGLMISQKTLFIASDTARLEQIARGGESFAQLRDSSAWKKLREDVPEQAAAWGIDQTSLQVERLFSDLKLLMSTLEPGEAGEFEEALSNIPDAKVFKKYATNSIFYAVPDERGVYLQSHSARVRK